VVRASSVWRGIPMLAVAGIAAAAGTQVRFQAQSDLAVLHVSVSDDHGSVPGLTRDAFTVIEDGIPQPIAVFSGDDTPVTTGLLIDDSTSMSGMGALVTSAVTAFVGAIVMVPMKDPDATDYNINGDSFCVTTNTVRNRVDVTDGSCSESEPMIKAGLITMGIGGAMALIGFHKVTVSPQMGHKVVGATMSVTW
jgi:hypothetical protein